jgi:hypothetical protein
MRTKVFITIDTEFSIGGSFADPLNKRPIGAQSVLCEVKHRSEGLGFLLETFRVNDIRATFFIEALQTEVFGDQPMGDVARSIARAGHDVQLHLHPVWTYFERSDWQQHLAVEQPTDSMHGRSLAELTTWMQRGIDTFARWGLPRPTALRTGNLMVDRNVYRAMSIVGLCVGSNVARALFEPDEHALRFNSGMHAVEGITEIPVLSYTGLKVGRWNERKSLTITGTSTAEVVSLLQCAHRARTPAVVLLTHCHEFVKGDFRADLKVNKLNQGRLVELCRFLAKARDLFDVTTMDRVAAGTGLDPAADDPLFQVPARHAISRMLENKLSEWNAI